MSLSYRHRQILELLLRVPDDITAGEIAAEINVSTRTIHRELSELETLLADSGLILQKKSGKGIQLQGKPEDLELFRRKLQDETYTEYSAQERKLFILCTLIEEEEPVKLFTLSHELQVSIPTITHDLDELEEWLQKTGVTLVRKRGYGVELRGEEPNKRRLIAWLARNYLDVSDLFGRTEHSSSALLRKLLELIGKVYFAKVEAALWQAEEKGLHELTENEYTSLLIDISISIARIKQGKQIELQANQESVPHSTLLRSLIEQLSSAIPMEFSTAEADYIAELLKKKQDVHPNQLLPLEELNYRESTGKLIRKMEEAYGIPFSEDRSLREGLLSHLDSALGRLRAGAQIRNPLLAQIKKDYEPLFQAIRAAVDETIIEIAVPDEEIGFLVMHFGASIERQKQFSRDVKAILVCTSGIGTSKMLAVRLTKEFPQIEILGLASWFEAARIPESDYDLIISTVELPLDKGQYIKLSPLLPKEEAEQLRSFIQTVTLKKGRGDKKIDEGVVLSSTDRLHRIRQYVNDIVWLIDHFYVHTLERSFGSLYDALQVICHSAKQEGFIDEVEPIVQLLMEREKQSSQIIPDTGVALFHIRSELVRIPSFTLYRLHEDLPLDTERPSGVREVLLMLGPLQLSKESLEVLSEISSYLLLPEMIDLLKNGSQQDIRQLLARELTTFLETRK
jgi:mannitol operon transcriptional antiterminator